jgi:hypothetical protein
MQFNTYEYVEPEFKEVRATSEYAAQHFHRMGWMWGRLEVMREQQTWGDLRAKRIEKELREKIIQEIDEARKPYLELAEDKTSEDYLYYNGFCNAMNFAKVIVGNPNDTQ